MFARRHRSSGGPFHPPGVRELTAAPHGGWTTPQFPEAAYYNGKTYFCWVNGTTGGLYVASYTHATGAVSTPFLIDTPGVDTHNNPALLVRDSDKRIVVAFCRHFGANMFIRVSTNPEDVTAFGAAQNLGTGSNDHTYPAIVQLTGVANDPIYVFYRDFSGTVTTTTGRLAYVVSEDDGATWSTVSYLMTGTSNLVPYWSITTDNDTRIDVISTDRDPYGSDGGTLVIAHFYIDGTDFSTYESDGTEITATRPFNLGDATTVYDGADGDSFVMDSMLSSGEPRFTFIVATSGSTISARHARWTGSAWTTSTIYNADWFPVDRYFGSAAFDHSDPSKVYVAKKTGASTSELYRYTTPDNGATWDAGLALTSGSSNLNAAPIGIHNGVASLPTLWLRGTISSSTVFDFATYGLRS